MLKTTTTIAFFIICIAGTADAQNTLPSQGPRFGEIMIDLPLVGLQTKDDFAGGLFVGIGGHVNLIPIGNHDGIGIGTALTLTGENRPQTVGTSGTTYSPHGKYGWTGRTAIVMTVPMTFMCDGDGCFTITPLYEIRRFNWTNSSYVDTESRSFGLAINFSYHLSIIKARP